MELPKINTPTYELEIPSTKQRILFRPFLVKEEKILLMALQGTEVEEMIRAVKQIVTNCIISPGVEIEKLQSYDLEYIFLQLRIRSTGSILKLRFDPIKNTECTECQKIRLVDANLEEAKVVFDPNHENKVQLTDKVGIALKSPNFKSVADLERANAKTKNSPEDFFKVIWSCVDYIYDDEKTYSPKDYTLEQGLAFIEELNHEQFGKIEKFFKTLPKLKLDVEVKCDKCGFKEVFPIVGLESFFV